MRSVLDFGIFLAGVALANELGLAQRVAFLALNGLLRLFRLLLDLSGFDETALFLVVLPRRGAIAFALVLLILVLLVRHQILLCTLSQTGGFSRGFRGCSLA